MVGSVWFGLVFWSDWLVDLSVLVCFWALRLVVGFLVGMVDWVVPVVGSLLGSAIFEITLWV